jgi:hypothetical protein
MIKVEEKFNCMLARHPFNYILHQAEYDIMEDSCAHRFRFENSGRMIDLIFHESEDPRKLGEALLDFVVRFRTVSMAEEELPIYKKEGV